MSGSDEKKPKDLSGYQFSPSRRAGDQGISQATPPVPPRPPASATDGDTPPRPPTPRSGLVTRPGGHPLSNPTPVVLRPRAAAPVRTKAPGPIDPSLDDSDPLGGGSLSDAVSRPLTPQHQLSRASGPTETSPEREERIVCSFPGLLKLLIPEESFVPFPVAVRVANLSSGGALVETHDSNKINPDRLLTNRYFELKVAHTEIPDLRGRVVWTDFSSGNPRLGLACFERSAELARIVQLSESAIQWEGPPPLPTPQIDPFPPTTAETRVVLTGHAADAMEVVVKRDRQKFTAPVTKGIFRIPVELAEDSENEFLLRSYAGERRSRLVPIRIVYEKSVRRRSFYFDAKLDHERKGGPGTIQLDFNGSVRQAERVLYRFSQLMGVSERVSLSAKLFCPTGFDQRMFETLRAEGAVLAADTTKNQVAAKLLDDLL